MGWWEKRGGFKNEAKAQEWWREVKLLQKTYTASLPKDVLESLQKSDPDFIPIGFEWGFQKAEGPRGSKFEAHEFNGDGKPDYLFKGISRIDILADAFRSEGTKIKNLKKIHARFCELSWNEPAKVWVGLSSKDGLVWSAHSGSYVDTKKITPGSVQVCGDPVKDLEQGWLAERKCEQISIGCCERDGQTIVWDPKKGQLVNVGGC